LSRRAKKQQEKDLKNIKNDALPQIKPLIIFIAVVKPIKNQKTHFMFLKKNLFAIRDVQCTLKQSFA